MVWKPEIVEEEEITEASSVLSEYLFEYAKTCFPLHQDIRLIRKKVRLAAIGDIEDGPKNTPAIRCDLILRLKEKGYVVRARMKLTHETIMEVLLTIPSDHRMTLVNHLIRSFFCTAASELDEQTKFNTTAEKGADDEYIPEFHFSGKHLEPVPILDDEAIDEAYKKRMWSIALQEKIEKMYKDLKRDA